VTERKPKPAEAAAGASAPKPRVRDSDAGHDTQLSNIRHSLRTPLNQIIGYSEMLQEEAEELSLQDSLPDLQKIHAAGGQLLALVNDNLTTARVTAGKLDLEALQRDGRTILNLIFGYTEMCQEYAAQARQDRVAADLERIRTAAENLLALLANAEFLSPLTRVVPSPPVSRSGDSERTTRTAGEPGAGVPSLVGSVLVVDDNEVNRDMLSRRLERQGHTVIRAEDGRAALDILKSQKVDVVLLDILMPEMDGVQTLAHLKADERMRHTPVIMLSALDELDSVVRCIEMGAEDYLPKPFNPVLLKARLNACLEKKRLRDKEQAYLEQLQSEREKSERLLLNILPQSIAHRLKQGETTIADTFSDVTVLFADLVDFTKLASSMPAAALVRMLNEVFSQFDWLAELHRIEKIKTIGDAYMVVGGLPTARPDHAAAVAEMALDMQNVVARLGSIEGFKLELRLGMSSGPVVAGIIGSKKFIYDLWGDTVNTASRMESHGVLGRIQVSESTYELLKDTHVFERRGRIKIKGKGEMATYFLTDRK
jgi:adenylate cyclase